MAGSITEWLALVAAGASAVAAWKTFRATAAAAKAAKDAAAAAARSADAQEAATKAQLDARVPIVEAYDPSWLPDGDTLQLPLIVRNRADVAMRIARATIAQPAGSVLVPLVKVNNAWVREIDGRAPTIELRIDLKPVNVIGVDSGTTFTASFPLYIQPPPAWRGGPLRLSLEIESRAPAGPNHVFQIEAETPARGGAPL